MKYTSWRGTEGIAKALDIQQDLWDRLGKKPSRDDFTAEGRYNVYMALYRSRRRGKINDTRTKLTEVVNLLHATKDPNLIEKIFGICIHKLTPSRAEDILDKIKRRFN